MADKKKGSGIVYHLLVCMLLIVTQSVYNNYIARKSLSLFFLNTSVIVGVLLIIIYLNVFFLIPKFHSKKKYFIYFSIIFLFIISFIYLSYVLSSYTGKKLGFEDEPLFFLIASPFFYIGQYLIISFFLYNLKEKYQQEKRMDEMQVETLRTEINYLRAQINPHFLFNTLNNLYALSLERSDKTPEVILHLSKIMDYMLYETDDTKVYLQKDIENIEHYINLEKIRQGNNAVIHFTKGGTVSNQKIVPLLLLPLVENAFKHGINTQISNAFLSVNVKVTENNLQLAVTNSYKINEAATETVRRGIGLANLQRRLQLFYPGKHQLEIKQDDSVFMATLAIDLL